MSKKNTKNKQPSATQRMRVRQKEHGLVRLDVSVLPENVGAVKEMERKDMIKSGYKDE